MNSESFKDVIHKMRLEIVYSIDMYKKDLALNNLQWLICHKTKPNQPPSATFKRRFNRFKHAYMIEL